MANAECYTVVDLNERQGEVPLPVEVVASAIRLRPPLRGELELELRGDAHLKHIRDTPSEVMVDHPAWADAPVAWAQATARRLLRRVPHWQWQFQLAQSECLRQTDSYF